MSSGDGIAQQERPVTAQMYKCNQCGEPVKHVNVVELDGFKWYRCDDCLGNCLADAVQRSFDKDDSFGTVAALRDLKVMRLYSKEIT